MPSSTEARLFYRNHYIQLCNTAWGDYWRKLRSVSIFSKNCAPSPFDFAQDDKAQGRLIFCGALGSSGK